MFFSQASLVYCVMERLLLGDVFPTATSKNNLTDNGQKYGHFSSLIKLPAKEQNTSGPLMQRKGFA